MKPKDRIIVALDVPTLGAAMALVKALAPHIGMFKVGSELYTAEGPSVVRGIHACGEKVFLDLKFHDNPHTVLGASRSATRLGVRMFNVHCLGDLEMMRAARKGVEDGVDAAMRESDPDAFVAPLILGVTVLTSHNYQSLLRLGLVKHWHKAYHHHVNWSEDDHRLFEQSQVGELVAALASAAREAGLDGVVASPREISVIRHACGSGFKIVTPGIRPSGALKYDQQRVGTPAQAIADGADWIVVGRPITQAPDPVAAAKAIAEEIAAIQKEGSS